MVDRTIHDADAALLVLDELRGTAGGPDRLTRSQTFDLLQKVYSIRLTEQETTALMAKVRERRMAEGANRSFTMGDNPFRLLLRYIFPALGERANICRYSGALQYLQSRMVPVDEFHAFIKANGGIVEMYWRNCGAGGSRQYRSKLTLSTTVHFTVGTPITLKLMPNANGVFTVVEQHEGEPE